MLSFRPLKAIFSFRLLGFFGLRYKHTPSFLQSAEYTEAVAESVQGQLYRSELCHDCAKECDTKPHVAVDFAWTPRDPFSAPGEP